MRRPSTTPASSRAWGSIPTARPKRMRYANAAEVHRGGGAGRRLRLVRGSSGPEVAPDRSRGCGPRRSAGRGQEPARCRLPAGQSPARPGGAARPPMHAAMLIPNPLLPDDYFTRQEVDDFVLAMNADVAHSLLDCPGRYTVRVATFTGAGTFDDRRRHRRRARSSGLVDVNRFLAALKGSGWKDPQLRGWSRRAGSSRRPTTPIGSPRPCGGPAGRPGSFTTATRASSAWAASISWRCRGRRAGPCPIPRSTAS